jgi:hypothetical protein
LARQPVLQPWLMLWPGRALTAPAMPSARSMAEYFRYAGAEDRCAGARDVTVGASRGDVVNRLLRLGVRPAQSATGFCDACATVIHCGASHRISQTDH